MKVCAKEFSKDKKRVYNPNSYGYLDAGLAFLIFTVSITILAAIIRFILKHTGAFYAYMQRDEYFVMLVSITISQAIIILFAFVYSRIRKVKLFSGGGYAFKWNFLDITMACILSFGVLFVLQIVHGHIADNFGHIYGAQTNTEMNGNQGWAFLLIFIVIPLFPAFCEEAFMRGIIVRSMEKFGVIFTIIVSGFTFGIFHANPQQLLLQSIGGMATALVFISTKNFVVTIASHCFHNLFTSLYDAAFLGLQETSMYAFYWAENIMVFVGVIAVIIGLIYFINKLKKSTGKNKNISSKSKVYLLNTETNVVTEEYAYNVEEYTKRLNNGELFLNGENFISHNKLGGKVAGFVLICIALVVGIIDVFLGLENIILPPNF